MNKKMVGGISGAPKTIESAKEPSIHHSSGYYSSFWLSYQRMGICSNATVTNSGALSAAVFDCSVPQGIQGATVIWVAVHESDVCGDLRDLLFASSPDLRKSALFIFEIVLHRRKSFDNGLDFLPELASGQIIPNDFSRMSVQ